jgi:hypothetical protein
MFMPDMLPLPLAVLPLPLPVLPLLPLPEVVVWPEPVVPLPVD